MKIEINIMPWCLPMLVELPIQPMLGSYIELSDKDFNRYISIIKNSDLSTLDELKDELANAPATLADDEDEYCIDLYYSHEVKEINIVWNNEANNYVPQAVLGKPYDFDDDDFDEDEEDEIEKQ